MHSRYNMPYVETSAFSGEGLDEAVASLRDLILASIDGKKSERLQRPKLFSVSSTREEDLQAFEEWKHMRESSGLPRCCR